MHVRRTFAVLGALALAACNGPDGPPPPTATTGTSGVTVSGAAPTTSTGPSPTADPAFTALDGDRGFRSDRVAVYAGRISTDGTLTPVHRGGFTGQMSLASVVKLYVVVAVLREIDADDLEWSTPLQGRPQDFSAGSGTLGDISGRTLTVREALTAMLQQSDNTATSLLVRSLGQDTLRAAVRSTGHSAPEELDPFMTIRQDMWLLGSPRAADARAGWRTRTAAQRLASLAPSDQGPPESRGYHRWQDRLGYFASASDVAGAWAQIVRLTARVDATPLQEAFDVRRGNPAFSTGFTPPATWLTTWFKSGANAGVTTGTWLGRTGDGYEVVVVLANTSGTVAAPALNAYATRVARTLSERH